LKSAKQKLKISSLHNTNKNKLLNKKASYITKNQNNLFDVYFFITSNVRLSITNLMFFNVYFVEITKTYNSEGFVNKLRYKCFIKYSLTTV